MDNQMGLFGIPEPIPERKGKETPVFRKGKLYALKVSDVKPDINQPRRHFDPESLQELAQSISRHGILQPVLFRTGQNGELVLIAGQRRWQAAIQAGLNMVPAIYADGEPAEIALVENLLRQDLTAIEEAEAINRLKLLHNYHLDQLNVILGKSVSTISEIISLNRLPDYIRDDCRSDSKIARSVLLEISKLSGEEQMMEMYRRYRENGISRDKLRQAVRNTGGASGRSEVRQVRSWSRKFSRFDLSGIEDSERCKLKTELEKLHEQVNSLLERL